MEQLTKEEFDHLQIYRSTIETVCMRESANTPDGGWITTTKKIYSRVFNCKPFNGGCSVCVISALQRLYPLMLSYEQSIKPETNL